MNIGISVSFDKNGNFIIEELKDEKIVRNKGKSLLTILDEFTVIDIETTGFHSTFDEIIEIGAIKYRYNNVIDTFNSYVALENKKLYSKNDNYPLNAHSNITVGMLRNAPEIKEVLVDFFNFIEEDVLIAHNANFDINFIYDKADKYLNIDFSNDFIDTLRLVRRLFPDLPNHKLSTLCEELNLCKPNHRSLADCYAALELYNLCKNKCAEENIYLAKYNKGKNKNKKTNIISNRYKESIAQINKIMDSKIFADDKDCCLKNKNVVFTGALENLIRKDATQLVINLGGSVSDNINKSTNYLVMGMQDYSKFADGKESSKTKKAKKLIEAGQDLQIIDENEFIKITSLKLQEG